MVVAFSGQVCFFAGSLGSGRHETYLCRSDRIVHRDGPYLLGEGSMVARLGTARGLRSAKIKLPILTEGSPSWWCRCCSMRIASVDLSLALKHVAAVSAGCECRELCGRIVSQKSTANAEGVLEARPPGAMLRRVSACASCRVTRVQFYLSWFLFETVEY